MRIFVSADPTGRRACGVEVPPHRFEPVSQCSDEIRALASGMLDPALTPAQHSVLKADVWTILDAARNGRVSFVKGNPEGKVIRDEPWMYELRVRAPRGRLTKRVLRIYCAEPKVRDRVILGLHLATKPHGAPDVAGEQDSAIQEARRRAEKWAYTLAVVEAQGRGEQ